MHASSTGNSFLVFLRAQKEPERFDSVLPAFLLPHLVRSKQWQHLKQIVKILRGTGIQYTAMRNFRDRVRIQHLPEMLQKDYDVLMQQMLIQDSNHK